MADPELCQCSPSLGRVLPDLVPQATDPEPPGSMEVEFSAPAAAGETRDLRATRD